MNRTPLGITMPVSRWSRVARRLGALSVMIVAATAAFAQSLAFQTLAGTAGVSTPFSNSAPVTFNNPHGVAVDATGITYIADMSNHVIRRIAVDGTVSTLAGSPGVAGYADDTTGATLARFSSPQGVALNAAGDRLYVADTLNHVIRVISLSAAGGTVTSVATLAGTPGTIGSSSTTFNTPRGIAADTLGNLYVTDAGSNLIRKIVIAGPVVSTVAGLANTAGAVNGDATQATFNAPFGIAVNSANDTLYVADFNNHVIRRITLGTSISVTTFAGTAGTFGFIDGAAASAAFRYPTGVAVDASGNVLVVDFGNNALRQISAGTVSTVAGPAATGTTTSGASGAANGIGTAVRFTGPTSIATRTIGGVGYVYIADTNNHLIRQGAAPALPTVGAASPATQTASVGATGVTFTATVTGGWPTPGLKWQIQPGGVGSFVDLIANSTYLNVGTSTLTINNVTSSMNNDRFRLVATTSAAVEGAAAALSVTQAPSFASGSVSFTAVVGRANTFIVAATGSSPITYGPVGQVGSFTLASNGTITGTPTSTGESIVTSVTANNPVGSASQLVSINVVPETSATAPTITSASSATFVTGQTNNFTFTASGAPTPIIGLSGTLPPGVSFVNGLLTGTPIAADNSSFPLTVTATSTGFSPVTQSFVLTVSAAAIAPAIVQQPQNVIANLGQNTTFTASASGSPSPTLRWERQASGSSGGFAELFDDGTYSGTTSTTLTITNLAAGMSGDQFRLVARNASGTSTSSVATLTVNVGTIISTFAGQAGISGANDGTGTNARFSTPASIAVDAFGNFYVADTANHVIRKISPSGVVTTLAGLAGASGSANGTGAEARFSGPSAIAVNSVGTVFVADTFNQTIRSITPGGVVTTIAGLAGTSGTANGSGTEARFNFPGGIAVDLSGNIYVADSLNHTIRRIQSTGGVTTFAGAAGVAGSANGTGDAARFNYPTNLAVDSTGNIYVADGLNHTIRRISPVGAVTTLAGNPGIAGATDSTGSAATFNRPSGVAVDTSGNVYVADTNNHTIRRITSSGMVTTIAGSVGQPGSTDGAGALALFNRPFALTVDQNGNLFIADTGNNTIRRSGTVTPPAIATQPANRVVPIGGTATFTVVATGTPAPSYQWQRQAAGTSGFVNLSNDGPYSGVNTATLSVTNLTALNSGDQFQVVVTNGVNPAATSEAATLTIGEAPVITSAASTTVRATDALSFTFTASGSPSSTFSATSLPTWATLSSSGVLSGTPPAGSEGTYPFTVTANNGATATQAFTLTVTPAIVSPAIMTQPATVIADQGTSATFSVVATGTAPLNYQWRRNGTVISGATASTYTVGNAQASTAGVYSVTITNAGGAITSAGAELVVNTAPVFTTQPRPQVVLAGSNVTFTAAAIGGQAFNYQWRKNGVPIAGATNSSLTLTAVTAADAGSYDVQVSNALGLVTSSLAQLTVSTTPVAPLITAQPASRTALIGSATALTVSATGAPAPSYQWRKDGNAISGATNATLGFTSLQGADAGSYDVVVSNGTGAVTSNPVLLRAIARSYAGVYFGSFAGGLGNFGLYVREDNTAVFLGYLPGSTAPVIGLNVLVNDNGTFSFSQGSIAAASASPDEPARAAALAPVQVSGTIGSDNSLSGSISGGANASFSGTRASDTGVGQSYAGFYQAGAANNSTVVYTIAGGNGQAFAVVQAGNASDGGSGNVNGNGLITVTTSRSVISESVASTGLITGSSSGAVTTTFSGASEAVLAVQRLVNISSRARVGSGDAVAIAGFVISGEQSKPVLIRAVGPSLVPAPFNIAGALTSPRLELFSGRTSLGVNSGIAANRLTIDAAGAQAGAFPLGSAGNDAAILTTLAPGNYTAVVSSTTNAAGVALVEVYDLSAPTPGQKLLNISTRASAGTAENTLIAGFVVPAGSAKRVLVRGVGPGLAPFGVTGVLAQPTLTLFRAGGTTVAQNTNWNTSTDAAAITAASAQVGAFGLANADSAIIVTLAPGDYTAQVVGVGGAVGVALIEVYELP